MIAPDPIVDDMTPEEQRIAIAKSVGWVEVERLRWEWDTDKLNPPKQFMVGCGHLPDFLNDLNAMHEIEELLQPQRCSLGGVYSSAEWEKYYKALLRVAERDGASACHLLAAQRAEAYLRTNGLWKDCLK